MPPDALLLRDPVVETMIRLGIPLTRDNYLDLNYPEGVPEDWSAEHESELPQPFRDDETFTPEEYWAAVAPVPQVRSDA